MDLTLRQLSVVEAVARSGSFTAAAERLRVSQSALSRTVAGIERTVGVPLFERTTRRLTLTAAGHRLLSIADRVLAAHRVGMNELARYLSGEQGTVTVATLPSVAAVLLPPVLSTFRERHPGISVRILDGVAHTVVDRLLGGEADLAITTPNRLPAELAHRPLVLDRFYATVPPRHRLAAQQTLTWADLAAEPFVAIGVGSSVRAFTDAAFESARVRVPRVVEAANVATVGGLVAAGLGISALPALVRALVSFAQLAHRPLTDPVVDRQLDVVLPATGTPSATTRKFLDMLGALATDRHPLPCGVAWVPPV
jgi:LysR family carnitine catabolism transcriptional activator